MRIENFTNSFFVLKSKNHYLSMDPWIGKGNCGGCHAFPFHEESKIISILNKSSYIYISHLHSDHFSPEILKKLDLSKVTFLIIKYSNNHLKNALLRLGAMNIIEFKPWEVKIIGIWKIAIIPQIESNSDGIKDTLNYDLDTSIIVQDNSDKSLFFNKVDNPLSIDGIKLISEFCKKEFNKSPDIAALTCGAASEWPQAFILIDRETAKKNYIKKSLQTLLNQVKLLNPKFLLICGGIYKLAGKFQPLEQYVAVPSLIEIFDLIKDQTSTYPIYISKGGFIESNKLNFNFKETDSYKITSKELSFLSSIKYDYQLRSKNSQFEVSTDLLFDKARLKLLNTYERLSFVPECQIIFNLYDDLRVSESGEMIENKEIKSFELFPNEKILNGNKSVNLIVHLDEDAFKDVLLGNSLMKQIMSGSMALQERTPDIFTPGTIYSLAYLKI